MQTLSCLPLFFPRTLLTPLCSSATDTETESPTSPMERSHQRVTISGTTISAPLQQNLRTTTSFSPLKSGQDRQPNQCSWVKTSRPHLRSRHSWPIPLTNVKYLSHPLWTCRKSLRAYSLKSHWTSSAIIPSIRLSFQDLLQPNTRRCALQSKT